jgi:hypothetical protein
MWWQSIFGAARLTAVGVLSIAAAIAAGLTPPIPLGATKAEVIQQVGWPNGRGMAGDREAWTYRGYRVVFESGVVVLVQPADEPPQSKRSLAPQQLQPRVPAARPPASPQPSPHVVAQPASGVGTLYSSAKQSASSKAAQVPLEVRPTPTPVAVSPHAVLVNAASKLVLFLLAIGAVIISAFLLSRRRQASDLLRHLGPLSPTSEDPLLRLPPRQATERRSGSATEQTRTPSALTFENLQTLEWKRIEELNACIFSADGWRAEMTCDGSDGGIDIKLTRNEDPERRAYVQCKAWSSLIGVKPVRELFGVMAADGVAEGYFVTTGSFTADARAFAVGKTLHLVSGRELVVRFTRLPEADRARILAQVFRDGFATPSCPQCSSKMVMKGAFAQYWTCPRFPVCRSKPIQLRKSASSSDAPAAAGHRY